MKIVKLSILFALILTAASLEHIMKLSEIKCSGVAPINLNCSWTQVNNTLGILDVDLYAPDKLETVMVHIQVFYKYLLGGYKPFIIDTIQDFCAFSKEGNYLVQLGEIITRNIKQYFVNTQCPIEGHALLKEVPVNLDKIVGFFPTGDYKVNLTLLANSKPFAKVSTTGSVELVRKGKSKNKG